MQQLSLGLGLLMQWDRSHETRHARLDAEEGEVHSSKQMARRETEGAMFNFSFRNCSFNQQLLDDEKGNILPLF